MPLAFSIVASLTFGLLVAALVFCYLHDTDRIDWSK